MGNGRRNRYFDEYDYQGYSAMAMDIAEYIAQRVAQEQYRIPNLEGRTVPTAEPPINININFYGC